MNLPKLYCKDSKGNIRFWEIEVSGSKFRTVSGIDGTDSPVYSEWTECEGKNLGKKNETSPEEQAKAEAKAKHKKALETGYFESIDQIKDDIGFFEPMLAHKYEDHEHKLPDSIYVSPKMDGVRIIISKDGVFSRKGKKFPALQFIREELDSLFNEYQDAIFDGEAYSHALKTDFDKIISLSKKTKNVSQEDIEEAKKLGLKAYLFDLPKWYNVTSETPFKDRLYALNSLVSNKYSFINVITYKYIGKNEIADAENEFLSDGYEGLMARCPNSAYENKRSYKLLKLKRFFDDEFEILDILEGQGNRSGMMGRVKLKAKNGNTFEANARGNESFYVDLLKNKSKYIGKTATVRYQNLTPTEQVPRFGVIVNINREAYE